MSITPEDKRLAESGMSQRDRAFLTAIAVNDLAVSLSEHGFSLAEPANVNAVAVILQCAGWHSMAQGLLEQSADENPDAWATYSATVVAELMRQRDEDRAQDAEVDRD